MRSNWRFSCKAPCCRTYPITSLVTVYGYIAAATPCIHLYICCCCHGQVQKPAPLNLLLLQHEQWTALQIRTAARNGPEAMDDFLPGGGHPEQWSAGMHGQRPARELIFGHYCCIHEGSLPPVLCIYAQNIFVAVNFEEESNTTEAGDNDDSAMLRFELYEAIVRASMSRCSTSLETCDVSDATQTFIAQVRQNAIIPFRALSKLVRAQGIIKLSSQYPQ